MPLPDWAILGSVIYPRPRDSYIRIIRESGAIIVYALREEVQLNQNHVVFSVDSETLEHNWMPLSEAAPLFSDSTYGPMPSWFTIGSRIIQNHNNLTYIILSFDPIRWSMTATLEDEVSPTNFTVTNFIRHWRPASSITEQKPTTNVTNIVQGRVQVAPDWLYPGKFLRRKVNPNHVFVVSSLDPRRFVAVLTRLDSLRPMVLGSIFEEADYCRIDEQFTQVDSTGSPAAEYTCKKCGETGERDYDAEERRASIDTVRAYTCKRGHTWYFVAGTDQDGKPANPSRFERDIGI